MKLRYYTDKEIESLKSNMFVKNILHKRTIEYDVVFKLWCIMMRFKFLVKRYLEELDLM